MAETNKTLTELQNAKDNLKKVQKPVEIETEVEDVEFVQFFAEQNASRSSRSCPASDAQMPKRTSGLVKYKCEVCSFETEKPHILKGHMTKHENIKCKTCDLQLKTMKKTHEDCSLAQCGA